MDPREQLERIKLGAAEVISMKICLPSSAFDERAGPSR